MDQEYSRYASAERDKVVIRIQQELLKQGQQCRETLLTSSEMSGTSLSSPVLLAGSSVVQGMGQMLVLAVGQNK